MKKRGFLDKFFSRKMLWKIPNEPFWPTQYCCGKRDSWNSPRASRPPSVDCGWISRLSAVVRLSGSSLREWVQGQRAQGRWVTGSSAGGKEGNPAATADLRGSPPLGTRCQRDQHLREEVTLAGRGKPTSHRWPSGRVRIHIQMFEL